MSVEFKWNQAHMGGGGYITGILQDPVDCKVIYTRCDVAGVFKSEDGGKSFRAVNNGMTECHHHSVRSFAMDANNQGVLFRCSGDARGTELFGSIHKSIDYGESWYEVSKNVDFYGNGPTRMCGEVICVDPFDSNFVASGGYSKGLWISNDGGESFQYSGLAGERLVNVVMHPRIKNRIYAASIGDEAFFINETGKAYNETSLIKALEKYRDFKRNTKGRLYVSEDRGNSWSLLCEGYNFSEIAFDKDSSEVIYAAAFMDGILKSIDGGRSWTKKTVGLIGDISYKTIAIDPVNSNILYAAPDVRGHHSFAPYIAVYKSVDKGECWNLIKEHSMEDLRDYPGYITVKHAGWAISKVRVDYANPNRLFMSNWYGMSVSEDGGQTWCGNNFKGTETTCIENVVAHPTMDGKLYFTVADHSPEVSFDNGEHYTSMKRAGEYTSSTSLVASSFNSNVILYGAVKHRAGESGILRSYDGGKSFEVAAAYEKGLFIQAIAEDKLVPGNFYAYIDGEIERGAGLYKSSDWGKTWTALKLDLPKHIKTLPHEKQWIEEDLLPVVVYQVKNVCGTNQLLVIDTHRENTIYVGEWTEGIFRSFDGGSSWTNIGEKLPFKRHRASILNVLKADEAKSGVIYAGFIREGLWRSTDFGEAWTKVFPLTDVIFNASSLAIGGKTGKELCIVSEPLYWSNFPSSVYYSYDNGTTWQNISPKEKGALRWKGVAMEKSTGRIHGVTCGNGAFYCDLQECMKP